MKKMTATAIRTKVDEKTKISTRETSPEQQLPSPELQDMWTEANRWLVTIAKTKMAIFAIIANHINDGEIVPESVSKQADLLCRVGASAANVILMAKRLKFIDNLEAGMLSEIDKQIAINIAALEVQGGGVQNGFDIRNG